MKSHWLSLGFLCLIAIYAAYDRLPTALSQNITNNRSLTILEQTGGFYLGAKHLTVCPISGAALRMQARAMVATDQAAGAADFLQRCLYKNGASHFALLDLGGLYWVANEQNLAQDTWSKLASQDPLAFHFLTFVVDSDDIFYTLPDSVEVWKTLIKVGEAAIQSAPKQGQFYLLMRQIYSERLEDPLTGVEWLQQGLKNAGEDWQIYWLLYGDTLALGDYEKAQIYLQKAWAYDESYQYRPVEEYYWRHGSVLLRQGQEAQAIYWLKRCLEVTPQNASCLIELGEALYLGQSYEESLMVFRRLNLELLQSERQQFVLNRIQEIEQILNLQP